MKKIAEMFNEKDKTEAWKQLDSFNPMDSSLKASES
jgi:hypothetical protein